MSLLLSTSHRAQFSSPFLLLSLILTAAPEPPTSPYSQNLLLQDEKVSWTTRGKRCHKRIARRMKRSAARYMTPLDTFS